MKETIVKKVEKEQREHHFYCDECGEFLGVSHEYEDGYYEKLGEFTLELRVSSWYNVKKNLCDKCKEKFINKVENALIELGFKK